MRQASPNSTQVLWKTPYEKLLLHYLRNADFRHLTQWLESAPQAYALTQRHYACMIANAIRFSGQYGTDFAWYLLQNRCMRHAKNDTVYFSELLTLCVWYQSEKIAHALLPMLPHHFKLYTSGMKKKFAHALRSCPGLPLRLACLMALIELNTNASNEFLLSLKLYAKPTQDSEFKPVPDPHVNPNHAIRFFDSPMLDQEHNAVGGQLMPHLTP